MRIAIGIAVLAFTATLGAQTALPTFAAPELMKAGTKGLGAGRLYPSPTFRDMNGDGRSDIVIGDLLGALTFAPRTDAPGAPAFGPEEKLLGADKEPLKFHNW